MPLPPMSSDEIVGMLGRSRVVNLVVEGVDDSFYFRKIAELTGNVEIIICDGRNKLLEVFSRRSEFSTSKVIFFADQDLFLFNGIPSEYEGIVWTAGYALENDLIHNSSIESSLFSDHQWNKYRLRLELLKKWFGYQINRFLSGTEYEIKTHVDAVIQNDDFTPQYSYLKAYADSIHPTIVSEPVRAIRGKNLVSFYKSILNDNDRGARFSDRAIMDAVFLSDTSDFRTRTTGHLRRRYLELTS